MTEETRTASPEHNEGGTNLSSATSGASSNAVRLGARGRAKHGPEDGCSSRANSSDVEGDCYIRRGPCAANACFAADVNGSFASKRTGLHTREVVTDSLRELVVVDTSSHDVNVGTDEGALCKRDSRRTGSTGGGSVDRKAKGQRVVVRGTVDGVAEGVGGTVVSDISVHVVQQLADFVVLEGGVGNAVAEDFHKASEVLSLDSGLDVERFAVDAGANGRANVLEFAADAELAAVVGGAEGEVLQQQRSARCGERCVAGAHTNADVDGCQWGADVLRDEAHALRGGAGVRGGCRDVHGHKLGCAGELLVEPVLVWSAAEEWGQDAHLATALALHGGTHGIGGELGQHLRGGGGGGGGVRVRCCKQRRAVQGTTEENLTEGLCPHAQPKRTTPPPTTTDPPPTQQNQKRKQKQNTTNTNTTAENKANSNTANGTPQAAHKQSKANPHANPQRRQKQRRKQHKTTNTKKKNKERKKKDRANHAKAGGGECDLE